MLYLLLIAVLVGLGGLLLYERRALTRARLTHLREAAHLIREALAIKELESARQQWAILQATAPHWEVTHELEVELLRHSGALEQAEEKASLLIANNPSPPLTLFRSRALIRTELGKWGGARRDFEEASPLLQQEGELIPWAEALLALQEPAQAIALLEEFQESPNPLLHSILGQSHAALGEWRAALHHYTIALEGGNLDRQLLDGMGAAYTALGQYTHAIALYRSILQRTPDDLPATIYLCHALEAQGFIGHALMTYRHSHAWEDRHPEVSRQAALTCLHAGRIDEAIEWLEGFAQEEESPTNLLLLLGMSWLQKRKWKEAYSLFSSLAAPPRAEERGRVGLAYLAALGMSREKIDPPPTSPFYQELSAILEARWGNQEKGCQRLRSLIAETEDSSLLLQRQRLLRRLRTQQPLDPSHLPPLQALFPSAFDRSIFNATN